MELEVKKLGFPRARKVTLMGVFARVDFCIKAGAFLRIRQFFFRFRRVLQFFFSFSSRSRSPQKGLRPVLRRFLPKFHREVTLSKKGLLQSSSPRVTTLLITNINSSLQVKIYE